MPYKFKKESIWFLYRSWFKAYKNAPFFENPFCFSFKAGTSYGAPAGPPTPPNV